MRTAKLVESDEETVLIDAKPRFHRRNRPALDQLWNIVLPISSRRNVSVLRETHAAALYTAAYDRHDEQIQNDPLPLW